MIKKLFFALVVISAFGCKKDDDDATVYKWKRDLYRAIVSKEGPASLPSADPKLSQAIFVNSDIILLTNAQKSKQQDSIYRSSDRLLAYKYEKIDK